MLVTRRIKELIFFLPISILIIIIMFMTLHALDPIKAARQQESMENARRRLQEKQDAKAAKFMEDQKLASIII